MHGVIFLELRRFVDTGYGEKAWPGLLEKAGLQGRMFLATNSYPDADLSAILKVACEATGQSAAALLEAFGAFIVPSLARIYAAFIPPEWKMLDLLENTETTIHRVVRIREAGAQPPRLKCSRVSKNEVQITYDSPRRLCALAKGIIRGLAAHYRTEATITESACMHAGQPACTLVVKA